MREPLKDKNRLEHMLEAIDTILHRTSSVTFEEDVLTETQQQMVRRSLTKAFEELYSGEVKKDARTLFVK